MASKRVQHGQFVLFLLFRRASQASYNRWLLWPGIARSSSDQPETGTRKVPPFKISMTERAGLSYFG
jgi:hypothetical protein